MAKELSVSSAPGLTVTIQLYSGLALIGPAINLTEFPALSGVYVGDMPPAIPYGQYMAIAFGAPNVVLGSNQLWWDGAYEMPIGLSMLQGLDPNNPMSVTPSERKTGAIDLDIGGDGETISTVQRV